MLSARFAVVAMMGVLVDGVAVGGGTRAGALRSGFAGGGTLADVLRSAPSIGSSTRAIGSVPSPASKSAASDPVATVALTGGGTLIGRLRIAAVAEAGMMFAGLALIDLLRPAPGEAGGQDAEPARSGGANGSATRGVGSVSGPAGMAIDGLLRSGSPDGGTLDGLLRSADAGLGALEVPRCGEPGGGGGLDGFARAPSGSGGGSVGT